MGLIKGAAPPPEEAGVRYGTTPRQVDAALRPTTRGAKKLRAILHGDTKVTLSTLEQRFPVELDSYRYHHTRHAWEQDRRRSCSASYERS